jgi:uncharacterized protein (UPF0332 family)
VETIRYTIAAQYPQRGDVRLKEYTSKLLKKAEDAIQAADLLLSNNQPDFAAGRAYYAMFYVAEALLNEKGLDFGKHGNVIAAYGEYFTKTGLLDKKYHRWLINAFDKRLIGDYGVDSSLENDIVTDMIDQAQTFWDAAKSFLFNHQDS